MSTHYLCGVDFQEELAHTLDYYDTVEALKADKTCWKKCGIVEVSLDKQGELIAHSWVVEQKL